MLRPRLEPAHTEQKFTGLAGRYNFICSAFLNTRKCSSAFIQCATCTFPVTTFILAQQCQFRGNICKVCTHGVLKIPGNLPEWVPHTKTAGKVYINTCPQKLYVSRYRRTTTWPQSLDFLSVGLLTNPSEFSSNCTRKDTSPTHFWCTSTPWQPPWDLQNIRQSMITRVNVRIYSGGGLFEHLWILILETIMTQWLLNWERVL